MKIFTSLLRAALLSVTLGVLLLNSKAQQLAFPGAEGFGKYTTGGRGGSVYHVTNLNDSGSGSFRDAVSQSNRIVVFDVGGVINISSRVVISSNITVAGQTAPGDGITIYGNGIALNGDSGNDIIQYIRIRMGKNGDSGKDAVGISEGEDYIFDHVSISWGRDGTLDVNGSGIDNLTFQDCIIAQGINNSNHSTGGLMQSGKWSMIRSLYIDNKTRNPKARGTHEFINSVLYNWDEHGYIMGDTEGLSECNLIGNYFIYGPSSNSDSHITGTTSSFHVYPSGNYLDSDTDGSLDGSLLTDYKTATVETSAYSYPGVGTVLSAQNAVGHVVSYAGASKVRDEVDELLIDQLTSYGTQGAIINTEDDNNISGNVGTVNGGTAPTDSDQDGMPDYYENANGHNPNSADGNSDADSDGFTNIEEYLDWIKTNDHQYPSTSGDEIQENTTGFCNVDGSVDSNNAGYTGAGFANTDNASGNGIEWRINASSGGSHTVTFRYANGGGSDRPGNILVDGNSAGSLNFASTGSWTSWSETSTNVTIGSGVRTIELVATGSSGLANIDWVEVSDADAQSCTSSSSTITIQENATGFCSVDGTVDSNNAGYTGSGFANTDNATGEGINWEVSVPSSGTYTLVWGYANGSGSDRDGAVIVNSSTQVSSVSLPGTGAWTSWDETSGTNVTLSSGTNTIRLEANTSNGLANIDFMDVTGDDPTAESCSGSRYAGSTPAVLEPALNVYPNPASETLKVDFSENMSGIKNLKVFDVSGQLILQTDTEDFSHTLDIKDLKTGTYILEIKSTKNTLKSRFIKQ